MESLNLYRKKHDFNAILDYLFQKDVFINKLFLSEINSKDECSSINKEKLIQYTLQERDRIAHAFKKKEDKEYFSPEQRIFYLKDTLLCLDI